MEVQKYAFLTAAQVSDWLGVRTSCERALRIHCIADWSGYITGLDMTAHTEILVTARKQI
jgi:hypothetical protein